MQTVKILRVMLAIATLLTALAMTGVGVWALFAVHPLTTALMTALVCFSIVGLLSFFSVRDYKRFFGKEYETKSQNPPQLPPQI